MFSIKSIVEEDVKSSDVVVDEVVSEKEDFVEVKTEEKKAEVSSVEVRMEEKKEESSLEVKMEDKKEEKKEEVKTEAQKRIEELEAEIQDEVEAFKGCLDQIWSERPRCKIVPKLSVKDVHSIFCSRRSLNK